MVKVSNAFIRTRFKPLLHLTLALPALGLAYNWLLLLSGLDHGLTANPIEYTSRFLGDWAMTWVVLGLAISPASKIFNFPKLVQVRRLVGLWAFSYVVLHVSSYIALDYYFDWAAIGNDILKRNFITIGMVSLILLIPMALTSTAKSIKRLGAKRWQQLHRMIYAVGPLVTLHYMMMAKGNQLEPKLWMAGVFLLLVLRVLPKLKK